MDRTSREDFVKKQLKLLSLEEEEEIASNQSVYEKCSLKDMKARGICLLKLQVKECKTSLYGRKIVTFEESYGKSNLSLHNLKKGDLVGIGEPTESQLWNNETCGIVNEVKKNSILVVVNDGVNIDRERLYHVFRVASFCTYKRMRCALKKLNKRLLWSQEMIDVLFGNVKPSSINSSTLKFDFINENLNEEQKEAVQFALCQKEIAVIHGPPGTGKTTTVVEIILQMINQGLKVLACAPSNVATDNLVESLSQYTTKIVRLGHPARTLPGCQHFNIDCVLSRTESKYIIDDIEKNICLINESIENQKGNLKYLSVEKMKLVSEKKKRQTSMIHHVLHSCDVVVSTLISAAPDGHLGFLPAECFDVVVIDECSQALEAACWIPLVLVKKCILAGDHQQLQPIILCDEAEKLGLNETLMDRVLKLHGDDIKRLLSVQYRMHKDIMDWPSKQLYDGRLRAHESVANHLLCDLPSVESNENTNIPLLLIDTVGCNMWDLELEEDDSKGNEGEADIVAVYVKYLVRSLIDPSDIAVITPYSLQVELIKHRLMPYYPSLEVRTVDGFQGREKEAVILSLVRSNAKGKIGFLRCARRINVAITRAKRHLVVICDTETVSQHPFLKAFVDYLNEKGEVRSAAQYEQEISRLPESRKVDIKELQKSISPFSKARGKRRRKSKIAENSAAAVGKSVDGKSREPQQKCNATLKKLLTDQVQQFLDSSCVSAEFPCGLSGFQRLIVHEIAEQLNLKHKSEGQGDERRIILTKYTYDSVSENSPNMIFGMPVLPSGNDTSPSPTPSPAEEGSSDSEILTPTSSDHGYDVLNSVEDGHSESSLTTAGESISSIADASIQKNITPALPQSTDTSVRKKISPTSTQNGAIPKSKNAKKKTAAKPKLKSVVVLKSRPLELNAIADEDFDALIAKVVHHDSMCMFKGCSKKIVLIVCSLCQTRFCSQHIQYEIHGCGLKAKIQAREEFRNRELIKPQSRKPTLQQLHIKMDKRLKDLEQNRNRKK